MTWPGPARPNNALEFMLVLASLRIPRATGSPFNPIAVL